MRRRLQNSEKRLTTPDWVAGVDLSLNHTGIVVTSYPEGKVLDTYTLFVGKEKEIEKVKQLFDVFAKDVVFDLETHIACFEMKNEIIRLKEIGDILYQIFYELRKAEVGIVGIENYAFKAKGKLFQIGEMGGILKYHLGNLKLPYTLFAPVHVKMMGGKHSKASKFDIAMHIQKAHNLDFSGLGDLSYDLYDAYTVATLTALKVDFLNNQTSVITSLANSSMKEKLKKKLTEKGFQCS